MTMDEFNNVLRKCFVGLTILIVFLWIMDILIGNYSSSEQFEEIIKFVISGILSLFFMNAINEQVKERNYPYKYFALCLGVFNLLGYIVWIVIRPKKL